MKRQKDSRSVKAVWSILLGLVMALSSFAIPAHETAQVRACSCCSCAQLDCCGTPVLPSPAPIPVNAKSTEQRVQTPALIVVALLTPRPIRSASEFLWSSEHLLVSKAEVPIYDRNCSYLI
jgi:hypothetical protein